MDCFANRFVVSWTIGFLFATIFQCVPVAVPWDKGIKDHRRTDSTAFWYAYCIMNILIDASILALPIREIVKLQLARRERRGLMLVVLLGAFSVFFRDQQQGHAWYHIPYESLWRTFPVVALHQGRRYSPNTLQVVMPGVEKWQKAQLLRITTASTPHQ
jgi:hypothetical protein